MEIWCRRCYGGIIFFPLFRLIMCFSERVNYEDDEVTGIQLLRQEGN